MTRPNGRTLAESTGWDVLLVFEPTRGGESRGAVAICTHPRLPGWRVHRSRRWALAGRLSGGEPVAWQFRTLWRAIEAGNREIERLGGGR